MKTAIGVDIGGTKILMVAGTDKGKILARHKIPTQRTRAGAREFLSQLKTFVNRLDVPKSRIAGVGIAAPGAVDPGPGIVPRSPHMGGWKGFAIVREVRRALGLPAVIGNDANAAALGEKYFGGGRKCRDFIYMTVSTGIGGGLIVNGQLVTGASYVGGEVGHMKIVPEGDPCKCGQAGCLEAYASGTGMAAYAERQLEKRVKSRAAEYIPEGEHLTAKILGHVAKKRDRLAIETYKRGGYYLGIGIANLLNILNPERVILGGGVLKSAPPDFFQAMRKSCKANAWPEAYRGVRLVRSKLNDAVGGLGALALAFEALN